MDKKEIEKAAKENCAFEDDRKIWIDGAEWALSLPKEVNLNKLREEFVEDWCKKDLDNACNIFDWFLPHLQKPVKSEWISVEDRLPKQEDKTTWEQFLVINANEIQDVLYFDWEYRRFTSNINSPKITHWMPLPKPPKNNSNN